MTWDEAITYMVYKPDTRFGLELQDVTSIVSNSGFCCSASAAGEGHARARRRKA